VSLPIPPGRVSPDNREHFDGLEAGKLLLPRCDRCGAVIWYPRHFCPACGSLEVSWFEASGRGTVHSFSIVRSGQGAYSEAAPYVLAYVELAEGPRVMTNLLVEPEAFDRLAIGQPVEMVILKAEGVPPLLRFRPAS
jgi:uncharacterized OB-fold protein